MKKDIRNLLLDVLSIAILVTEFGAFWYRAHYAGLNALPEELLYQLDTIESHHVGLSIKLSLLLLIPAAFSIFWVITRFYELKERSGLKK